MSDEPLSAGQQMLADLAREAGYPVKDENIAHYAKAIAAAPVSTEQQSLAALARSMGHPVNDENVARYAAARIK